MNNDILIIDDEADIRDLISDILKDEGFSPRSAGNSLKAFQAVDEKIPSAVILDIWLQGSEIDGIGILEQFLKTYPDLPIIMISGHANIETAVHAIKLGAYDFIEKPFKEERIVSLITRAIEAARLKSENAELRETCNIGDDFIGSSGAIINLRNAIDKIAKTESRVMITGAAGVGKEIAARLIHQKSKRPNNPFVILNVSDISVDKVDEELFGREIGHISSGERKIGILEKANGGTLFLDEVSDMPLAIQGKILKALQQNSFERVGGTKSINLNVRVISSTNKDLKKEIELGNFREDLFYRLNVVPLNVPSLNERAKDLPEIINYFIEKCSKSLGLPQKKFTAETISLLELYHWPGNIRQLKNVIEWTLIMAPEGEDQIGSASLPPEILHETPVSTIGSVGNDILSMDLRSAREMFEKQYLSSQLRRFGGNVSKTASFIGMERSAFHRKIKSLGIN